MTELIKGIYRLKIPLSIEIKGNTFGYVNTYLILGNSGYLIVDPGMNTDNALAALKNQLAEIGADFKDISRIVVSHFHPDHGGIVGTLQQLTRAKFLIHSLENYFTYSENPQAANPLQKMSELLRENGAPVEKLSKAHMVLMKLNEFVAPVHPDVLLQGGEIISTGIFTFQVLWTPGHSPGHICLYEKDKKILLSGDHILPTITPNIGLHNRSDANPLDDYIHSLNILKPLDVDIILPAHENPFTGLTTRIDELTQHYEKRKADILTTITTSPKTAYQICEGITWQKDVGGTSWHRLSSFDKRLAVMETLAHLKSMHIDGKVEKFSRDSILYYKAI